MGTLDFRPLVTMESIEETIKLAVNLMREELLKEFGRGRGAAKRTKDG